MILFATIYYLVFSSAAFIVIYVAVRLAIRHERHR
jgi:hypothetical protein